jgi:hypothetical protein
MSEWKKSDLARYSASKTISFSLPDLIMNHFTDEPTQNNAPQSSSTAPAMSSVDTNAKQPQREAGIRSSREPMANQSLAPTSNFDALNYATLSSAPRAEEFGEADPYVNPDASESGRVNANPTSDHPSQIDIPPAKTIDEIMQRLSGYQSEIESLEAEPTDVSPVDSESSTQLSSPDWRANGPTVEIIPASGPNNAEALDSGSTLDTEANPMSHSTPADARMPNGFFDSVASDQPAERTRRPEAGSTEAPSNRAVPLADAWDGNPEFGDPVFDVHDFIDSANGVIELIPGTQEFEPDFFEFNVVEEREAREIEERETRESATMPPLSNSATARSKSLNADVTRAADSATNYSLAQPPTAPVSENQLFVASTGDVIKIDGDDGFGYIDLACFDVRQASFEKQVINIDDGAGTVFAIQHHNIPYVLFADGVEVDLTPDESDRQSEK